MKQKISIRMICQIAMLIALTIVVERLCSINTPYVRIGFAFVPIALCAALFGPVWGGVAFGIADLIGAALFTGIFPGITISRICSGIIFGLFLHRKEARFFPNVVCAAVVEEVICALGLTTFFLALNSGTPFFGMLVTRLPQAGVIIALMLVVMPLLLKLGNTLRKHGFVPTI